MTAMDNARLVALLGDAGAAATWPATPDLRDGIVARITVPSAPDMRPGVVARIGGDGPAPVASPARDPRRTLRILRPLALAAILLIALAGIAAGLGFRLPGFDLERVARTPAAGAGLDLGSPVPIDDALAFDHPAVLVPADRPRPDTAYVLGAGDRSIVTLAWRAAADEPTLPGSDLALSLMAVEAGIEEGLLRKVAGPGTTIEPVDVDGARGWWIAGAPHELLIIRPGDEIGVLRAAIAGDTLVFVRDGTLYRLESALGRDATIEAARSMR